MKMMRPLSLMFALLLSACAAFAGVQAELSGTASVGGDYIRLKDVASLRGELQSVLRAGKVFLGPAPELGMQRTFSRADIQTRLMQQGFTAIELSGAATVVVTRQGDETAGAKSADSARVVLPASLEPELSVFRNADEQAVRLKPALSLTDGMELGLKVEPEVVRNDPEKQLKIFSHLLEQALQGRFVKQFGCEDLEVSVKVFRVDDLPEGLSGMSIESMPDDPLRGAAMIQTVLFDSSRKPVARVKANAQIKVFVNQPTALRNLQRGDRIRKGDIKLAKAELNWSKPVWTLKPEDIGKYSMTRSVSSMGVITADMVELASDVKKGELIEADTRGMGFRIYEQVRALEDGRVGETVRVQSLSDSSNSYLARVIAPGKVEIAGLTGGK